ncbi:hypothetical protein ABH932_000999 [Streptacidiphilus sp. MAP5-52]
MPLGSRGYAVSGHLGFGNAGERDSAHGVAAVGHLLT